MRKFIVFTLFFLICFSLFGQEVDDKKLFILPIDGYGKMKDNDYFYKQLAYEVIFQTHTVVESKNSSNYIFRGKIEPVSGIPLKEPIKDPNAQKDAYTLISERANPPVRNVPGRREFFSIEKTEEIYFIDSSGEVSSSSEVKIQQDEEGYYFILELLDTGTGEVLGRRTILFAVTDASVSKLVSVVVYDLLSNITKPEGLPKRGDSRDRLLYFDSIVLWMPKFYYEGLNDINFLSLGVRMDIEYHFLDYMSAGAGLQISPEAVGGKAELMLEVPIMLKFVLKLDKSYLLEPCGGATINFSTDAKEVEPSLFSWFAGVQFGIKDKIEMGMIVIDARFSMDFSNSSIPSSNTKYKRCSIQLGAGYKIGLIQKKTKDK